MTASAIPLELEEEVHDHALRGKPSRWISEWLWERHQVRASHSSVLTCIRRWAAEKEAIKAAASGCDAPPPGPDDDPLDVILRHARHVAITASEGRREACVLGALNVQLRVHRARREEAREQARAAARVAERGPGSGTLPEPLPTPFQDPSSVAQPVDLPGLSSIAHRGEGVTLPPTPPDLSATPRVEAAPISAQPVSAQPGATNAVDGCDQTATAGSPGLPSALPSGTGRAETAHAGPPASVLTPSV